ncbi:dihydroorotate dehydrogenase electron transfer subunit [Elusimicrobiota bacterium]
MQPGYYRIVFRDEYLARFSYSGQFCLLTLPGVFLRRPFSIYATRKGSVEFLYKVLGKGTKELSQLKPGEKLKVLGPLGTSYDTKSKNSVPLLVGGGTGIASLNFLAQQLKIKGVLFYGAKSKSDIVTLNGFNKWKVIKITEDGSIGQKGLVTRAFEEFVKKNKEKHFVVYACGPNMMLKKVSDICSKNGIKGFISLEEMMACGVGNCQGCAIKAGETYKMVCKDGPVFNIGDVEL